MYLPTFGTPFFYATGNDVPNCHNWRTISSRLGCPVQGKTCISGQSPLTAVRYSVLGLFLGFPGGADG